MRVVGGLWGRRAMHAWVWVPSNARPSTQRQPAQARRTARQRCHQRFPPPVPAGSHGQAAKRGAAVGSPPPHICAFSSTTLYPGGMTVRGGTISTCGRGPGSGPGPRSGQASDGCGAGAAVRRPGAAPAQGGPRAAAAAAAACSQRGAAAARLRAAQTCRPGCCSCQRAEPSWIELDGWVRGVRGV